MGAIDTVSVDDAANAAEELLDGYRGGCRNRLRPSDSMIHEAWSKFILSRGVALMNPDSRKWLDLRGMFFGIALEC